MKEVNNSQFPLIPEKRYHTIGEASQWCGVETHVLRYWETLFPQINPIRRAGRRFYRPEDMQAILQVYTLLREKKYTIDGALKEMNAGVSTQETYGANAQEMMQSIRRELEGILAILK